MTISNAAVAKWRCVCFVPRLGSPVSPDMPLGSHCDSTSFIPRGKKCLRTIFVRVHTETPCPCGAKAGKEHHTWSGQTTSSAL